MRAEEQEESMVLFSTPPSSNDEILCGTPQMKIVKTMAFDSGNLNN